MTQRQSVRAIVINGDKMLVMKRNKYGDEFYTLVGGGLDAGEDWEMALRRELREETGLEVGSVHLVFIGDGGDLYGTQQFYTCEYLEGEPTLSPDSEEAKDSKEGRNTYLPMWLPLRDISHVPFKPVVVGEAILEGIENGFPEIPHTLAW
jgi:8-oxo-dGTP diphosphatase